jgi:hypothetical protein
MVGENPLGSFARLAFEDFVRSDFILFLEILTHLTELC